MNPVQKSPQSPWTEMGRVVFQHIYLKAFGTMLFIGVFGTAWAFVWFYEGVRAIGPARAAAFINLVPVAAITLGVLLLGEPLELSMLAGGALVIAGIWILNRPSSPPPLPVASTR